MNADESLFDPDRHVVVRSRPGAVGEVVRNAEEAAKYLRANPDGCVVYDAIGVLDGRAS